MKFSILIACFSFLLFHLTLAAADTTHIKSPTLTKFTVEQKLVTTTTSSTTASPTLVWITTTADGNPATIQVTYSQTFSSFYTQVAVPSSGSIGLGTISGTVGTIRTYRTLTVSDGSTLS